VSALVWIAVGLLGGVGALGRFFVDGTIAARAGRNFPIGTMVVNVSGAALLGLLVGLGFKGDKLLLAGTATLGSYTTFSTWMLETQRLVEDGELGLGTANILVSLGVGLGAAALGRFIGAHL
jgi:fluoride exporter